MIKRLLTLLVLLSAAVHFSPAWADEYQSTIEMFRESIESRRFLDTAYGYAVFPTIGKGGYVVGGAFGTGRVYESGHCRRLTGGARCR